MTDKKDFGNLGENIACEYIQNRGYKILERNYRVKTGEIDIIAVEGEFLVFLEVKTRRNDRFGMPSQSVSYWKQQKIVKTALNYIQMKKLFNYMTRFDVIEIVSEPDGKLSTINLIKNAFYYSGKYGY